MRFVGLDSITTLILSYALSLTCSEAELLTALL